ncbi:MAG TPA: S-layer homology domain-containing protein [Clostridiales bacterium]|nr:S-layer homology domain-containing protein [Clostridiales bacterium]
MKKASTFIVFIVTVFCILQPMTVFAQKVELGYEGGISSGTKDEKTPLEYSEVCFLTGEPIVFSGTVSVKKTTKQDTTNATYTYNLKNIERSATLTRSMSYNIRTVKTEKGQIIEELSLSRNPSETIRINNDIYVLRNYEFSNSEIIDKRPAIDYSAGNMWGRKTYQAGNANNGGTVTVEITGKIFGYDHYWGNTETAILNYEINSERKNGDILDRWGGNAKVIISSSIIKEIKFMKNIPEQISFEGGYVRTYNNSSMLEYYCCLPEFDSKGISNYRMVETRDILKLEALPEQTRLPVYDLSYLRGHWAEKEINILHSLGVFNDKEKKFNPEAFITRGEFIAALVEVFWDNSINPSINERITASGSTRTRRGKDKAEEIISPYKDIPTDHRYFPQIGKAHKNGLVTGRGQDIFAPEDTISLAEIMVIFVRALGLEDLAPNPYAITSFQDDISIPAYARNAIYAADRMGLIEGDNRGYLKPDEKITKAKAAILLNNFITYMREGIRKDYQECIIGFN